MLHIFIHGLVCMFQMMMTSLIKLFKLFIRLIKRIFGCLEDQFYIKLGAYIKITKTIINMFIKTCLTSQSINMQSKLIELYNHKTL